MGVFLPTLWSFSSQFLCIIFLAVVHFCKKATDVMLFSAKKALHQKGITCNAFFGKKMLWVGVQRLRLGGGFGYVAGRAAGFGPGWKWLEERGWSP